MYFSLFQYIFVIISSAAGGFAVMAVRDFLTRPDMGHAGRAKLLAPLSGSITLVFAIVLLVSLL